MPKRPAQRPIDTADEEALAPDPLVAPARTRTPAAESEEWEAPPPIEPVGASRSGRFFGGGGGSAALWRRRLLGLGALAILVLGGVLVLSKLGGPDAPAPVPAGPKKLKTVSVTIPEGLTEDDMAKIAKKAGLKGSYEKAAQKAAKKFKPAKGEPAGAAPLEGFLFPATYEVEKGAPASDLVDKQLEAFQQNIDQVDLQAAAKKKLSEFDVVTIASMIEREVQVPDERPIVASVIYNRLKQGIPLEIDATVRYALDNNFDKSLTTDDLQVDSPYNTYRFAGLPAGPIGNPGLDSLQAAADPAKDDFLYYVVKPGTCGEHFFTDNYDEFLAASQKYDAAQAAAGGSPVDCG